MQAFSRIIVRDIGESLVRTTEEQWEKHNFPIISLLNSKTMFVLRNNKLIPVTATSYNRETMLYRVQSKNCDYISNDVTYPDKDNVSISEIYCPVDEADGVQFILEKLR